MLASLRTRGDVEVVGGPRCVPRPLTTIEMRGVTLSQAPDLHERLQEVAEQGWPHVVLDEGTNRLVKHMKRAARGFRNRSNYRRRVRLP